MKLSPMMEQYMEIKNKYPDCILFFRLGDFYEMFFDDAVTASKELELTLTGKSCGMDERAPMCGVPFHAAEIYIARMVERGYKIAVCEQMEDPALAKGLVKRDVIRIVTPGTVTSQSVLNENENNYLASVYADGSSLAIAYADISTGELYLTEYRGNDYYETLLNELVKIKAKEIMVSGEFEASFGTDEIKLITDAYIDVMDESYFSETACEQAIYAQFGKISLRAVGIDEDDRSSVKALGSLLIYLRETQKQELKHITHVNVYEIGTRMALDKATLRNLEITETLYTKQVNGSLLGILDKTHTAMGSRRMRQWLREPLNDPHEINRRLDGVENLFSEVLIRNNIKEQLKRIYDFERLTGRVASGNANGKDMIALRNSIAALPEIKSELDSLDCDILKELNSEIECLDDIYDIIERAVTDEPPFTIKDGGLIKEGYSKELDDLKFSIKDGKEWISGLEAKERERTGIKTIKVGYNKVFGYYIEVSRSFTDQVPDTYIRKQTLVGGERYITPELKEMENLVLNAETKINQLEYDIFCEIREYIQRFTEKIQRTSQAIAELDVLVSFAHVSDRLGYVKPVVDDSMKIEIIRGRHPVIEQSVTNGLFVSNDTCLDDKENSMLLITGPNMAGKSTYMRQTALIVLMAQAGCFVPCESARIGVVDRIFTRIGASDNLAQGQSTFFVEMSELSYILNNAKERSLVILDEIGRGTSTYDGLSIAWALVEYLCNSKLHIRTLFATHYHELTALADEIRGVKNLNVDVSEENGNIVFLHKIVEGSASRSYGIHVAKLAGVPEKLLSRAETVLSQLEDKDYDSGIKTAEKAEKEALRALSHTAEVREVPEKSAEQQLSLFDLTPDPILTRLRELDLMEITPSQAIQILEELKKNL